MTAESPQYVAEAVPDTEPRRGSLFRFGLFGVNGLITAATYTAAFWLLREIWPHNITTNVVVAWASSVVANYLGGRLIFRAKTSIQQHLPRYLTVLAGNALLTWGIASWANSQGLPDFAVAYLPVLVTAIPSFLLMQRWVFASPPTTADVVPMRPAPTHSASEAIRGGAHARSNSRVGIRHVPVLLAVASTIGFAMAVAIPPAPFYFIDSVNHYLTIHQYPVGWPVAHYTMTTTVTGPFYPFYAMYAGTINLLTATAGSVVGSPLAGYMLSFILAFLGAMLGTAWLAKLIGAPKGPALLVGLVYTSSSYYLTNVFGRGAWTEVIATSALPLAMAATYAVLVSKTSHPRAVAACILSVMIWSGAHLITFVFGSIFILIIFATSALVMGPKGLATKFSARSAATAACAVGLGILINAWFLIPQFTYSAETKAGRSIGASFGTSKLWNLSNVLNPVPTVPSASTTPNLYATVPTFVLLWAVAALGVRSTRGQFRAKYWLHLVFVLAFYLFLTVRFDQLKSIPRSLKIIQFPYRFVTYDTLLVCGLAALAICSLKRAGRREKLWWGATGLLVVLIQLGLAAHQVVRSTDTLASMRAPALAAKQGTATVFYGNGDYSFLSDHPVPETSITATLPVLMRNPSTGVSAVGAHTNALVALGVQNSPFVRVRSGGTRVGVSAGGLVVVRTDSGGDPVITVGAVPERARVGEAISAIAILAALVMVLASERNRRRAKQIPVRTRHGAR